jgi:hypothetical protein
LQQLDDPNNRHYHCHYPENRSGHLLSPLFRVCKEIPAGRVIETLKARFRSAGNA